MTSMKSSSQIKTVPMVILAATKSRATSNSNSNHSSSTESVKPSALKKPKTSYTRQCSAPSSSSSVVIPSSSNTSSRRNSGEEKSRKMREKSPCVSFDADVVYVEPVVQEVNVQTADQIQGISSQSVISNLVLREGRTDISDV